jgi:hypothetical protein
MSSNKQFVQTDPEESISKKIFKYTSMYMFVFVIFCINMFAVSIALQCNKDRGIFFRLMSLLFSFCFGFIYIIINLYTYRFMTLKKRCEWSETKVFPIF